MALTMTRTRTQTALTKLVERLADVNGELAFVEALLDEWQDRPNPPCGRELLEQRRSVLLELKAALHGTIKQFDDSLSPADVGERRTWMKRYGRTPRVATLRYLAALRSE